MNMPMAGILLIKINPDETTPSQAKLFIPAASQSATLETLRYALDRTCPSHCSTQLIDKATASYV